jgi:hypothetical protein
MRDFPVDTTEVPFVSIVFFCRAGMVFKVLVSYFFFCGDLPGSAKFPGRREVSRNSIRRAGNKPRVTTMTKNRDVQTERSFSCLLYQNRRVELSSDYKSQGVRLKSLHARQNDRGIKLMVCIVRLYS